MKKFLKSFQKQSLFVKILIVLLAFGLVVFVLSALGGNNTPPPPPQEEGFSGAVPIEAHYYYMDGCGHCEKFSPEWDKFTKSYKGPVKLKKINMKDAEDDLKKYEVDGFPTVVVIDDQGKSKHYDGDRTKSALMDYFK